MIARHFKTFQAGEMVSTEGLRIGSVEVWPFGAGKMRLLSAHGLVGVCSFEYSQGPSVGKRRKLLPQGGRIES